MADAAKTLAFAQRIIKKNGRPIVFQLLSATPADATKPWKGAQAPTVAKSFSTYGAFVPLTGRVDLSSMAIDDEMLKRVEQVVLVAGGTELDAYNQIVDTAITYRIDWFKKLRPGPTTFLYAFGACR